MLDSIDFSQDMPELLQLDFFERTQIEQVITNCEHVNEQGHTVCNVKVSSQTLPFTYWFIWLVIINWLFLLAVIAPSAGCRGECAPGDGSHWAEAAVNGGG